MSPAKNVIFGRAFLVFVIGIGIWSSFAEASDKCLEF